MERDQTGDRSYLKENVMEASEPEAQLAHWGFGGGPEMPHVVEASCLCPRGLGNKVLEATSTQEKIHTG